MNTSQLGNGQVVVVLYIVDENASVVTGVGSPHYAAKEVLTATFYL